MKGEMMGAAKGGSLRNMRHERFCREYAAGKSQAEAYAAAGYSTKKRQNLHACGTRLMRNVAVRRRINELQSYAAETESISIESLMREASQIQRAAMLDGNQSAAVAALTAKAKIAGLWVEKTESENTNLNYAISDQLPSEEQWEAERVERDNKSQGFKLIEGGKPNEISNK
jgi:phage terminase small subunit